MWVTPSPTVVRLASSALQVGVPGQFNGLLFLSRILSSSETLGKGMHTLPLIHGSPVGHERALQPNSNGQPSSPQPPSKPTAVLSPVTSPGLLTRLHRQKILGHRRNSMKVGPLAVPTSQANGKSHLILRRGPTVPPIPPQRSSHPSQISPSTSS